MKMDDQRMVDSQDCYSDDDGGMTSSSESLASSSGSDSDKEELPFWEEYAVWGEANQLPDWIVAEIYGIIDLKDDLHQTAKDPLSGTRCSEKVFVDRIDHSLEELKLFRLSTLRVERQFSSRDPLAQETTPSRRVRFDTCQSMLAQEESTLSNEVG